MAVTLGASTVTLDALKAMKEHNIVILTGANPTVGVAGWFPSSGHGYLSSTYCMGADNVLEATFVTTEGQPVLEKLDEMSDVLQYDSKVVTYRYFHEAFKPNVTLEPVATGGALLGSRLLPADALMDTERLAELFREIGPTMDLDVVRGHWKNAQRSKE
ncbi:hypothetical protein IL306_005730 [Fusarium sp. DS 682]|nr:hypothetical protein IL306_005730 [Fusarium sp. DS 682]